MRGDRFVILCGLFAAGCHLVSNVTDLKVRDGDGQGGAATAGNGGTAANVGGSGANGGGSGGVADACSDGALNGDESDVDCGGSCSDCPNGSLCNEAMDCVSAQCVDGVCCDGVCAGTCEACDQAATLGACTPHPLGADPEAECAPNACNGSGSCAPIPVGTPVHAEGWGDDDEQTGIDIGIDGSGNVIVVGNFRGDIDLGGGPLSAEGWDIFIAKFSSAGAYISSAILGGSGDNLVSGLGIASDGSPVVVGTMSDKVDFDGMEYNASDGNDVFVAKLTPALAQAGGWLRVFGGEDDQSATAVAVGPSDVIVVAGTIGLSLDLGLGALPGDRFLAQLSSNGTATWSHGFDLNGDIEALAVRPTGAILATGSFKQSGVTFDGGTTTLSNVEANRDEIFAVEFDASGVHQWSESYGGADNQTAFAIDVAPDGSLVVGGAFDTGVTFDGGMTTLASAGKADAFVARLTTSGDVVWSARYGAADDDTVTDLAVRPTGTIVLTGAIDTAVNFGGGTVGGGGGTDVFLAKLSLNGDHLWSRGFGDIADQRGHAVTMQADGSVCLVGTFAGTMNPGNVLLDALDTNGDAFFALYAP